MRNQTPIIIDWVSRSITITQDSGLLDVTVVAGEAVALTVAASVPQEQ